jgi:hypothetical protein
MITAHDLLLKYLDYQCNWVKYKQSTTRPAQIREQQLIALLKAFGITPPPATETDEPTPARESSQPTIWESFLSKLSGKKQPSDDQQAQAIRRAQHMEQIAILHYFTKGTFLHQRVDTNYPGLIEQATAVVCEKFSWVDEKDLKRLRPNQFRWMYHKLMPFREDVYSVTGPWGGMLEGFSVGYWYSHNLAEEVQKQITPLLSTIDQVLCQIIDPLGQAVTLQELVHTYGYPDVDMEEIDREWRIAHY